MTQTVLILGASGRFGRNAAIAFRRAGWTVVAFDRKRDDLHSAARGADVIVNAWNPPYPDWARQVPGLHAQVIEAAKAAGATVIVPGNVYVFGAQTPEPWGPDTPHRATNPLGRIRIEMEAAYRASGVRTIILRAGDYLDTEASGNWFDQIMIKPLARGRFTYPGNPDIAHAWAFLPDLTRATVELAERREALPTFCDVTYAGYTASGRDIAQALTQVTGRPVTLKQMNWLPLHLARPFWPLARCLLEMRYLWNTPHRLDGAAFDALLPGFRQTPLAKALAQAVPAELRQGDIHPDQPVAAGV
ncbi:Rossmann-fold NAD(P)-binding domain-containing protein [Ruegeria aquimaris]|uniref:Sugar nucleotide-binding protein n=1 Tax=Ruegeria aquimaris TaxID=2984333 RepID=A0ABT3AHQ9_9RHOB|nr:sugar nucleotide-binding protein [Ruegeria sp. XHP0148]MCV2887716.1 sugar nucleotide-binding protein [Ruegeria sp. XHP0148]